MRKFTDIYYTDAQCNMQMLDMYLPDTEGFPVFVFFHGGGLINGDRTHCQCLASYLPKRGVGIVSVEYRMYPDAKYPDFIEDAAAAVKWVFGNIGKYGGSGKIFVGGSSAGGYLSQMLCFDGKYLASSNFCFNFSIKRSFISLAASTVNVTTNKLSIATPSLIIIFESFSIITVVLPLPAPALTS